MRYSELVEHGSIEDIDIETALEITSEYSTFTPKWRDEPPHAFKVYDHGDRLVAVVFLDRNRDDRLTVRGSVVIGPVETKEEKLNISVESVLTAAMILHEENPDVSHVVWYAGGRDQEKIRPLIDALDKHGWVQSSLLFGKNQSRIMWSYCLDLEMSDPSSRKVASMWNEEVA